MPNVDRNAPYVTQNLPPVVSAEERAEIRSPHYLYDESRESVCEDCMHDWPCPTSRTLDALEAAERDLAELRGVVRDAVGAMEFWRYTGSGILGDRVQRALQQSPAIWDVQRDASERVYNAIRALAAAAQEAPDADA